MKQKIVKIYLAGPITDNTDGTVYKQKKVKSTVVKRGRFLGTFKEMERFKRILKEVSQKEKKPRRMIQI